MLAATPMRDGGDYAPYKHIIPLNGPYEYGCGAKNGGDLMTYCSKVAEAVVGLGVMSGKTNSQAVCPIQMNKFQSRLQDVVERQCKEDSLPQPHDVFDKYKIYQ